MAGGIVIYRVLADAVLILHFAFILFVIFGGLLVLRWRRVAWLHVPAAIWGSLIEFGGWVCPLTPLENHLRRLAGQSAYDTGFIEHYLLPIVYPAGLTRGLQLLLGFLALGLNVAIYAWVVRRARAP